VLEKSSELQSSGNVPNYVAAADSPAGGRNVTGFGFNRKVGTPDREIPVITDMHPTPREVLDAQADRRDFSGIHRDKKEWEFDQPFPAGALAERFVLLDRSPYEIETSKEVIKRNREMFEAERKRNLAINHNRAEIDDEDSAKERSHD